MCIRSRPIYPQIWKSWIILLQNVPQLSWAIVAKAENVWVPLESGKQKVDTQHYWEIVLHPVRIYYFPTMKGFSKLIHLSFLFFNVFSGFNPPYALKHLLWCQQWYSEKLSGLLEATTSCFKNVEQEMWRNISWVWMGLLMGVGG